MARSFNGTTDKIDAGTTVAAPTGNGYLLTLSAWFNPSTLVFPNSNGSYAAICGRNASNNVNYIVYLKSTGKLGWYVNSFTPSNPVDPGSNSILGAGTWNHVAFTINFGTGGTGYLNGASDATIAGDNVTSTSSQNFQIGADNANPGTFNFPGSIADVAVWNVLLTALEIGNLAKGIRPWRVRTAALVGYWPLDGLVSPEPDLSGGLSNGTLTGTAGLAFGPPLMPFTPRWPLNTPAPSTSVFRKTLSPIGARIGSRQAMAA